MVANHQPYIYIYISIYTVFYPIIIHFWYIYIYNIHACSNLFRRPSRLAFKTGRNSNWIEFRRVVSVGNWVAIIHLNDITINNNDIISSWLFYGDIYIITKINIVILVITIKTIRIIIAIIITIIGSWNLQFRKTNDITIHILIIILLRYLYSLSN